MSNLDDLKAKYAALGEEIDRLEGKKDWPQKGDKYWVVDAAGVMPYTWQNDYADKSYMAMGNVFPTKGAAERHKLRLQAMASRWMPEEGEEYWTVFLHTGVVVREEWDGSSFDLLAYWLGNVHRSEADAKAWWDKFGKGFEIKEDK